MRENLRSIRLLATVIVLLAMLAGPFLMNSTTFLQEASAATREFEENITIPANDRASLELAFSAGDELELIFTVIVKEELPIYFWFMNYANYVRLVDGNEFLFFIDGSGQNVTQASKIVSVTVHDVYKLVLVNYNNQSVEVYLTYDVTIYPVEEDSGKETSTPLWKEFYVMLPLGLVIGILVGLLASRMTMISGRKAPKAAAKGPSKRTKTSKGKKPRSKAVKKAPAKKKVEKIKKKEPVVTKKTTFEEIEEVESGEEEEPEVVETAPSEEAKAVEKAPATRFCGHCGKPVETAFCPHCGKEVLKP